MIIQYNDDNANETIMTLTRIMLNDTIMIMTL